MIQGYVLKNVRHVQCFGQQSNNQYNPIYEEIYVPVKKDEKAVLHTNARLDPPKESPTPTSASVHFGVDGETQDNTVGAPFKKPNGGYDYTGVYSAFGKTENVEEQMHFTNKSEAKTEIDPGEGEIVRPGDEITYAITWRNGTNELQDVIIKDKPDPGVDFVGASYKGLKLGTPSDAARETDLKITLPETEESDAKPVRLELRLETADGEPLDGSYATETQRIIETGNDAAADPAWAEKNPFYYMVARANGTFTVSTNGV